MKIRKIIFSAVIVSVILVAMRFFHLEESTPILDIYDEGLTKIYDEIWGQDVRYQWGAREIERVINIPADQVKILDSGCGTGTHYYLLSQKYNVVGLDISKDMIERAFKKNPGGKFVVGDMNDRSLFDAQTFTHIISMYEATFYNEDLERIFKNYHYWLQDEGILIFEVMNRDDVYENIGPSDSSAYYYKKGKHVAHNMAAFTKYADFESYTWWEVFPLKNVAIYHEKLLFKDGTERYNKHKLFLPPISEIEQIVERQGFELLNKKPVISDSSEIFYVFKKR